MGQDPLSDVLSSVRLRGAVFYSVTCGHEWAVHSESGAELASVLMPGVEHLLAYHMFIRGGGWVAVDGLPPVRLTAGDIVMLPRGDAHVLSSAPHVQPQPDRGEWMEWTTSIRKPISLSIEPDGLRLGDPHSELQAGTVFVCGFVGCDLRPFNPLIAALPRLMHLNADVVGRWVGPILWDAVQECRVQRPGSAAVLGRVSEMVFVDAARRYLDTLPDDASGWLAALRDRGVGRAITLMHERPAEPWTVEDIGRLVGMSRSALHQRFVDLVGQTPMQYLTQWRMQRAASLLRECNTTVAMVAQEVGYDTEAAFARAFKRLVGMAPGAWRRQQRRAH